MDESTPSASEPDEGGQKRAVVRPRANLALPTDRMKFDAQVKALRAIVIESGNGQRPVTPKDMAPHIGVVEATAGLNNSFFMAAGLITRVRKGSYKPTQAAIEFNREAGFDMRAAKRHLAEPLRKTWFYEAVCERLELGDNTDKGVIRLLAAKAGASMDHLPKLASLLDWLAYAGLITMKDGKISLGEIAPVPDAPEAEEKPDTPSLTPPPPASEIPTTQPPAASPVLEFSFDFKLTADDLAALDAEQIKALFESVGGVMSIQAALSKSEKK
jgi:hypothetical protein